ncbi:Anaerobic sulfite reductase subunit B [Enhygromyxa salina]|uniref:Anaerobic sulfite reductase subunit B n=1 Tax=Enhygromyxa salina TaxID=215803 RepID=A0A2S9XUK1_9BACT|nr:4Fe-4S dicluster domain-containing protein [Enhygromyxa salina]PRP96546.1 Anaerobic sulfite reductase subunit B [Enhygromyxa salina]
MTPPPAHWLERDELGHLLALIRGDGYRLIGPTVDGAAIIYDEIEGVDELPVGWTDEQAPGRYRLRRRDDDAIFGFAVGPHSWKQRLFPAREPLVQIRRDGDDIRFSAARADPPPTAFIGVRACELAAIELQDRVFVRGPFVDHRYAARREACLIIAVNCVEAGELCFCASMGTGPRVGPGYDLCLTELDGGFVVEAETEAGAALVQRLDARAAADAELTARDAGLDSCRQTMGRELDTEGLPGLLFGNLDHPRWTEVAERCLACGNCTQVCPTCFCFDVKDVSLLANAETARERSWDSCFGQDHSTIHGAVFRPAIADRYRQWLTHKFASWTSQFDASGCVGCGRCIAWCPVGIDVTEELSAIRSQDPKPAIELPRPQVWWPREDDPLVPAPARVLEVQPETPDTVTLVIERTTAVREEPGQFNMLSLPAIGDVPISVSGSGEDFVEHTLRGVGRATKALSELRPGQRLGVRGPFGSRWPIELAKDHPLTLIAGGVGLTPLRSAMQQLAANPDDYPAVRLFYGARSAADILYDTELLAWDSLPSCDVSVTVDQASRRWLGNIGFVTRLLRRKELPLDGRYFICGPEVMMRQVLFLLDEAGVPKSHRFVSIERNMKCAAGFCGRCQYGPYFVCKDGPIFRHDHIDFIFGQPGF